MAEVERSEKDYAAAFIKATGAHSVDVTPRARAHALYMHDKGGSAFLRQLREGGT